MLPGDYYIQFVEPSGYFFSPPNEGTDDEKDSDAALSDGKTAVFTLTAGQSDLKWDAGIYPEGSISDYVWNDLNYNGIQDDNEPGIPNVLVKLYLDSNKNGKPEPNPADTFVKSTTTDKNGLYIFEHLRAGDYFVTFALPAGFTFSPRNQGGNDGKDSDPDPKTFLYLCSHEDMHFLQTARVLLLQVARAC